MELPGRVVAPRGEVQADVEAVELRVDGLQRPKRTSLRINLLYKLMIVLYFNTSPPRGVGT